MVNYRNFIDGLPEPREGVKLIVSMDVAAASIEERHRTDLVCPDPSRVGALFPVSGILHDASSKSGRNSGLN